MTLVCVLLPLLATSIDAFLGRWNMSVKMGGSGYCSWLEATKAGDAAEIRLVGRVGGARQLGSQFTLENGRLRFVTREWFGAYEPVTYDVTVQGDSIEGSVTRADGTVMPLRGVRAPALARPMPARWGEAISLFNGRDLEGWQPTNPARSNWKVEDGLLINTAKGSNLRTVGEFQDFRLTLAFRCREESNSGIFLRGRYEVSIEDGFTSREPVHRLGGIYGFLAPKVTPPQQVGQWRTLEVELVGRTVTVVLDGVRLLEREEIPGPTGGALSCDESVPGPVLIQGDHGPIDFRDIVLRPALH